MVLIVAMASGMVTGFNENEGSDSDSDSGVVEAKKMRKTGGRGPFFRITR